MATKQDWVEYFELINEREPTAKEVLRAIEQGEIKVNLEDNMTRDDEHSSKIREYNKGEFNDVKKHAGNYLKWLKPLLLHPGKSEDASAVILWLHFAFSVILGTLSISTVIRRMLNATLNSMPMMSSIKNQVYTFNEYLFFYLLFAIAILYLAALPGLLLIYRGQQQRLTTLNNYLKYFVPVSVINLVALASSFFVPIPQLNNISIITNSASLTSLLTTLGSSIGLVMSLLIVGVAVLVAAQQILVMKARWWIEKYDELWLTLVQWAITFVILWFEFSFIIKPMFSHFVNTLSNF